MNLSLPYSEPHWTTAPISPTCERYFGEIFGQITKPIFCGKPTSWAYPSHGSGWMALCDGCAAHHHPHIFSIEEVIASGEKFEGM